MQKLAMTAVAAAIVAVLAALAAVTVTFVPGVAALYPATAFEAGFGAWFGLWGALASYLGLLLAGSVSGWFSLVNGLALAVSDLMIALASAIGIRTFKIDPALPSFRHAAAFYAVSLLLGSVPASLFYNYVNLQLGVLAGWSSFWTAVIGWNLGNAIVLLIVGLPLMRLGTPTIIRTGLFVRGYL